MNAMRSNSCKSIFQGLTFILIFYFLSSSSSSLSSYAEKEEEQYQSEIVNKIENDERILSRKRRFLAFPYGSSFSATICTTIGMYGNPNYNWISYALNFGVSYNLPNETWVVDAAHGFGNLKLNDESSSSSSSGAEMIEKRRTRRDLYHRIQTVVDRMGYDGKQCILRALCETAKLFINLRGTMVEEMLKTIFSYPGWRSYSKEELFDLDRYTDFTFQRAFQKGRRINSVEYCSHYFPNCSFSLLDLALGKYSVRPTTLMKKNDYSFL